MVKEHYYQDGLTSERLRTRWLTELDVDPWIEFFKDPEAIALFPNFGLTSLKKDHITGLTVN
jgi:hypothetical protein